MRVATDPTGLVAEANAFRYCPLGRVLVWRGEGVTDAEIACAQVAAAAVGVAVEVVDEAAVLRRAGEAAVHKLRCLGNGPEKTRLAALDAGWWVDDIPVALEPGREVLRWAREQAVSESLHRHGNVTGRRRGLPRRIGCSGGL
jgi:RHH-type proline utilization regulon transcriptional repressor/proline dehydrogenase/delta 1-pyrroline-5-carboxylate dehydrogenase